ncbi:MAG: 4Fe-4S binding protein [Thermodesulfobacteriota bacterium]
MIIDKEKCIGCERCHPYCPVGAIATVEWEGESVSEIDQEACVECGTCNERSSICPVQAIYMPELKWPRVIREHFSNPNASHPSTTTQGRGTEEMKTNDVTGRYPPGVAGVALEMGRPGIGTSFRDIQTVAVVLAGAGVAFEENNPVSALMDDIGAGTFQPEVLGEKVLSAILEFKISNDRLGEVLQAIKKVAARIDTVFSLDLISRVDGDGRIPVIPIAEAAGFNVRPNCKTNVGLGRPMFEEACK